MSWIGYVQSEEPGWAGCTEQAADSLWEGLLRLSPGGCPHQSSLWSSMLAPVPTPHSAETCSNSTCPAQAPLKAHMQKTSREHVHVGSGKQPGVFRSKDYPSGKDVI